METTKVCPNCGDEHENKRSEYCCKVKEKNCLNCEKLFTMKCSKRLKKYCRHKCSISHKRNECLTCGDPAIEKYCGKEITIVCKTCNGNHKAKCGPVISTYCNGVCAMKDKEIQDKVKDTQFERYGAYGFNSKVNLKYADMLEENLGVKVEFEHHVEGSFFDLYLPEHNIAIEINPTVTHNSTKAFACRRNKCEKFPCDKHKPLDRNYHYNRAKLAKDNDISLIQVYEWDSDESIISLIEDKIFSKDKHLDYHNLELKKTIGIENEEYNNKEAICYELLKNEQIIAEVVFNSHKDDSQWKILNYDINKEYSTSKILRFIIERFIDNESLESVTLYVDFNHETNKYLFLNEIGFKELQDTGPNLIWHNERTKGIIKADSKINNHQKFLNEGFVSIYTAGNRVFMWNE